MAERDFFHCHPCGKDTSAAGVSALERTWCEQCWAQVGMREQYRACGSPLRTLMQRLDDADAIRELQGKHAADPMPGDVDLFTGALFEVPTHEVGRRVLVAGGGVQEPLF